MLNIYLRIILDIIVIILFLGHVLSAYILWNNYLDNPRDTTLATFYLFLSWSIVLLWIIFGFFVRIIETGKMTITITLFVAIFIFIGQALAGINFMLVLYKKNLKEMIKKWLSNEY